VLYAVAPGSSHELVGQSFDGDRPDPPDVANGDVDWSRARGAFMLGGKLYTGWSDGHLEVRSLQGDSFGPARTVDLHGLNSSHFPVAGVTGMFFDRGRLYYTLAGKNRLYYRHFSPDGEVVGAQTFEAVQATGVNWADVRGMTLASGHLYYGRSDGSLNRIEFRMGRPVPGTRSEVGNGGRNWDSRGLFVLAR
jgi:hypothetical protein